MVDLTAISAALSSLKTISGLVKERKDPELTQQIIELQTVILQLQQSLTQLHLENTELKDKNRLLQQSLDRKDELITESGLYWHLVADKKDGPFCPNCWDMDNKKVRLQPDGPGAYWCTKHSRFHTAD